MLEAVFDCEYCHGPIPKTSRKDSKYCSQYCGNKVRRDKWKELNREKYTEQKRNQNRKRRLTPQGKFIDQRQHARERGIEFNLTFEQWWELWEPHWEERGLGGKVMCRNGDQGAYEIGNVRIDTQANNNREAHCLKVN